MADRNPYSQPAKVPSVGPDASLLAFWEERPEEFGLPDDYVVTCLRFPLSAYGGPDGLVCDFALAVERLSGDVDLESPEFALPGLPDFTVEGRLRPVRVRVFLKGATNGPWLELLRPFVGPETLRMCGLEQSSVGEASRVLGGLRVLRALAAGGRPSGCAPGWRGVVLKAKGLKCPGRTWEQVAAVVGVPERTLRRWRRLGTSSGL